MEISQVILIFKQLLGLTLVDFICLPERSRVSVSFSGEDNSEGFFSLRKL